MSEKNNFLQQKIIDALNQAYEHAVQGFGGFQSVIDLANDYINKYPTRDEAIDALVRTQNVKAFTSGFLSGAAGLPLLAVAIPANLISVIYVHVRMSAAIAYIRGFDLRSDQVKTMVFATLTGSSAYKMLRDAGVKIAKEVMEEVIKRVAIYLAAKFGAKLPVNAVKAIPIVGGIVGGVMDVAATLAIAKVAKTIFKNGGLSHGVA
jgi:hypothetical protein